MCASRARVSWTSATLSRAGVTSVLSALGITGSAGSYARIAGLGAGRCTGLARLASTLRLTSTASDAARISRTCATLRAACSATRTEAGIPATRTGETGRIVASSPGTFGGTCGPRFRPNANRQSLLSTTTELNIKVELVARFMSAGDGPGGGDFCPLPNENLSATQAAER